VFGTYLASVCRSMHHSQWAEFQMEVSTMNTPTHTHTHTHTHTLL
jgi:hypothetical protein